MAEVCVTRLLRRYLLLWGLWTVLIQSVLAQYGGGYGANSGSAAYGGMMTMMTTTIANVPANNMAVNFPLIQLPVTLGKTNNGGDVIGGTGTAGAVQNAVPNFLATLPASPVSTGLYPFLFANGAAFVDPIRNAFYAVSSNQRVLNRFATNPLNLSDSTAVGIAAFNGPLVPFLALGSVTTTASPIVVRPAAAAAASAGNTGGQAAGSGAFFAANAGNIAGLGVAGLGLQVPGVAPNIRVVPGASYAYATGNSGGGNPANIAPAMTNNNNNMNNMNNMNNNAAGSSYGSSGYGKR